MPTGKIKRIVKDRGFGFITDERNKDVFFHHSACMNSLRVPDPTLFERLQYGTQVEFELDKNKGEDRLRASIVMPSTSNSCSICDKKDQNLKKIESTTKLICSECILKVMNLSTRCQATKSSGEQGVVD